MEPVNGITVICGSGIGKTNAAIGKGIRRDVEYAHDQCFFT